jgi:nicotinamidase-related amidase
MTPYWCRWDTNKFPPPSNRKELPVTTPKALPIPPFHDPANAARWSFRPDPPRLFEAAGEWRRAQRIAPAGGDRTRIHLLLIDLQKDFCFPEGSLYVGGRSGTGAIDDSDRIARFLYRNLGVITETTCTLDTHFPFQIFFPSFWVDADGAPLTPHREIATADIRSGKVRPNPAVASWLCSGNYPWLLRQAEFYCEELEKAGKYRLYLWPPHCLLGGDGHPLAGVIQEARLFHSFVRGAQGSIEVKGGNALTENYSVLAPEVLLRHDGRPLAQRNTRFVETLLQADAVVVAGQAASHCVKSSIDDLLGEIRAQDEALARKVYVLRDCMSAVAVPDPARPGKFLFDFTDEADRALDRFAAAGMNVVSSTDPIESWPGMKI